MSETPSCFIERAFQPNKTAIFFEQFCKAFFRLEKTREKQENKQNAFDFCFYRTGIAGLRTS